MPNLLDDLLRTQIPQPLWHYTSIQAFQSIVEGKSIWATDVRFLNDREEFRHTRGLADEIAAGTPDLDEEGFQSKSVLESGIKVIFDHGGLQLAQVFVASFSASEDQLGQWRGYAHGSTGVSLGFDLSSFRPPAGVDTGVSFAPCVYQAADKKALVLHGLHHFKDEVSAYRRRAYAAALKADSTKAASVDKDKVASEYLAANPDDKDPQSRFTQAVSKAGWDFLRIASLLKHSSFEEEREWRLVLPILMDVTETMTNPPRFRAGRSSLVPYIAHSFLKTISFPLVDVILGPGSDENSVFAAERFLVSQGIRIKPRLSRVPYRSL